MTFRPAKPQLVKQNPTNAETVQRSSSVLKKLLQASTGLLFYLREKGDSFVIELGNDAFARTVGYKNSIGVTGLKLSDVFDEATYRCLSPVLKKALTSETSFCFNFGTSPFGDRSYQAAFRPDVDAKTNEVGIIAQLTDITGRLKINTLLNAVPQLIWTTTSDGRLIYSNSRYRAYACTLENGKPGGSWFQSLHPDDSVEVVTKWNASIISGEIFEAEYRLCDRKGEFRWFLGRAVPISDDAGHTTEWFGTATDIHEKKVADENRSRNLQTVAQLQLISTSIALAHTPVEVARIVVEQGITALEADAAHIVLSEPQSDRLNVLYAKGYNQSELESFKTLSLSSSLPFAQQIAQAIRQSEPVFFPNADQADPLSSSFPTPGSACQISSATFPLMVQGQAMGAVTFDYNVPRSLSENQIGYLTILAEQCAQALERARLFEAEQNARHLATLASKVKSQFLANMSHEIRTPMNSILGFADLLGDKALTASEREDYRNRIRMNGDQLMRLIDDVLYVSKAETSDGKSRTPIEIVSFSIRELVHEVLESMAINTRKKGILTRIVTDASVPSSIESDPIRLRQILTNVIGNSIKFTDNGRIETRISVKAADKPSDKTTDTKSTLDKHSESNPSNTLIIEIEDTGIGISRELHHRLFQPFAQGDSSVTRRFGGSGLGLSVSRGMAQALGGSLDLVQSDSTRGSVFRLAVPLYTKSISPQIDMFSDLKEPEKSKTSGPELKGVQVLLVEDSYDNEMLIRAYLKGTGAEVEVAHNGKEAIDQALDRNFDVVLMDIQMPVMDGLEATRRLREHNYDRPIIALSAHALPEEVERSLAAGCHSHLTKPIMRNVLIEQIRTLGSHRH